MIRARLLRLSPLVALVAFAAVSNVRCSNQASTFGDGGVGDDAGLGGDTSDPTINGSDAAPDAPPAPVDKCHVPPDNGTGNAPTCTTPPPPPNSFDPVLLWGWKAPDGSSGIPGGIVTPIVGELVDTDGNGEVNLCDVPSVVIAVNGGPPSAAGNIYMLAGDTGKVQYTFDGLVDASINPALGDIDGDKVSEIIANDVDGHLVAYNNKGKIKWVGPDVAQYKQNQNSYCLAIAIYDLDGDGKPEIIDGFEVFDNKGHAKFHHDATPFQGQYWCPAPTAADLDGDGKQEVIFGNAAYHADGSLYWQVSGPPGQPQVADFNGDGVPEIFSARQDGLMILSHDGKVLSGPLQSFDQQVSPNCWNKAGAVADFDGTGHASIMDGSCQHFGIWHVSNTFQMSLLWSAPIDDGSGVASSTAFDFLSRGINDAVYGDQGNLWVFDGKTGKVEFSELRSSGTLIEFPVVADVNNDGSADIVVVSNNQVHPENYKHTIDVWTDKSRRWIPTRRIWNQHAYHVTNVREDGTIPPVPTKSWQHLNTFRVNSQIENGGDCAPKPPFPN